MGNIMGKPDYRGIMVDGGQAQIKEKTKRTRIEYGQTPAMSAQALNRLRAESNEYDPVLVGKLIATKKLAPFYEGKFDEKGDGRSVGGARSDRASIMTSESRRPAVSQSRQVQQKKPSRKGKTPSVVDQTWLNTQLLECPICLLWYPKNINYCKCCKKPICTLCFVSMKRPNSPSKLISCPFCRHSNLTVVYRSPERILENKKPKSSVVCENIRPARIIIRPQPRPVYYRYNVAGGPPGQAAFAQPRPSAGARHFTFYNPQTRPQTGGPAYPARQLYSPTRYPPATGTQPSPASHQRVLSAQEAQAYEERALHRAIRLSMLDY